MAIMGDKMNGLHFKPSLEDCENENFRYLELGDISLGDMRTNINKIKNIHERRY